MFGIKIKQTAVFGSEKDRRRFLPIKQKKGKKKETAHS